MKNSFYVKKGPLFTFFGSPWDLGTVPFPKERKIIAARTRYRYQFQNILSSKKVSVSVSKNVGIKKSIGIGFKKIWYRKSIGIVQILGFVTHCHPPPPSFSEFSRTIVPSLTSDTFWIAQQCASWVDSRLSDSLFADDMKVTCGLWAGHWGGQSMRALQTSVFCPFETL